MTVTVSERVSEHLNRTFFILAVGLIVSRGHKEDEILILTHQCRCRHRIPLVWRSMKVLCHHDWQGHANLDELGTTTAGVEGSAEFKDWRINKYLSFHMAP